MRSLTTVSMRRLDTLKPGQRVRALSPTPVRVTEVRQTARLVGSTMVTHVQFATEDGLRGAGVGSALLVNVS